MAQPHNFGFGDDFSDSISGSDAADAADETGGDDIAIDYAGESDRDGTARAILRQAAISARASAGRALAALDSLVAEAPVGGFADWLADHLQPGAELSSDMLIAAFVTGVAAGGGAPATRIAAAQYDALAVCFLGNALIIPRSRSNNEPIQGQTFEYNIGN